MCVCVCVCTYVLNDKSPCPPPPTNKYHEVSCFLFLKNGVPQPNHSTYILISHSSGQSTMTWPKNHFSLTLNCHFFQMMLLQIIAFSRLTTWCCVLKIIIDFFAPFFK